MKCDKCGLTQMWYYAPETNERGWRCECGFKPGEPEGFCPQLDREFLSVKVHSLLHLLHESEVIYLSNNDHGDSVIATVEANCEGAKWFDQYSIVRFIIEAMQPSHAEYWQKISDGIMSGNDPRDRCHCGKLATSWSGGKHHCRDHSPGIF